MKLPDPRKVEAYECPECGGLYLGRADAEACAVYDRIEPGVEIIATDVAPLMRVRPEARALVDAYLEAGEADFIAIEVEGDVIPWEDDV